MLRVQFNDRKSMQQVEFKTISADSVQILGKKIPKSNAGFKMYRMNGAFLGDYSDYTEAESIEGGFIFSKKDRKE